MLQRCGRSPEIKWISSLYSLISNSSPADLYEKLHKLVKNETRQCEKNGDRKKQNLVDKLNERRQKLLRACHITENDFDKRAWIKQSARDKECLIQLVILKIKEEVLGSRICSSKDNNESGSRQIRNGLDNGNNSSGSGSTDSGGDTNDSDSDSNESGNDSKESGSDSNESGNNSNGLNNGNKGTGKGNNGSSKGHDGSGKGNNGSGKENDGLGNGNKGSGIGGRVPGNVNGSSGNNHTTETTPQPGGAAPGTDADELGKNKTSPKNSTNKSGSEDGNSDNERGNLLDLEVGILESIILQRNAEYNNNSTNISQSLLGLKLPIDLDLDLGLGSDGDNALIGTSDNGGGNSLDLENGAHIGIISEIGDRITSTRSHIVIGSY